MSEQQNVELIKSVYAAFTRGDRQILLDLFSEDLDFQHPMPQSIWPWAGKRSGRAGFAKFLAGLDDLKAIMLQCLSSSAVASKQPASLSTTRICTFSS